jgi:hypothetical protein
VHAWSEYRAAPWRRSRRGPRPIVAPLGALAVALILAVPAARAEPPGAAADADASRTVSAVWVEREASFGYTGFTTHYSCEGLRGKVRRILRDAGARPDFDVRVSCTNLSGVEPLPRVRIRAAMPVEATAEVLAGLAREPTLQEQTVARARGEKGTAAAAEATAQFPAAWQRVSFVGEPNASGRGIGLGDCELMQDMVRQVFPALGVRVLPETRLRCVPRQITLGSVDVQLEALRKLPEPKSAAAGR